MLNLEKYPVWLSPKTHTLIPRFMGFFGMACIALTMICLGILSSLRRLQPPCEDNKLLRTWRKEGQWPGELFQGDRVLESLVVAESSCQQSECTLRSLEIDLLVFGLQLGCSAGIHYSSNSPSLQVTGWFPWGSQKGLHFIHCDFRPGRNFSLPPLHTYCSLLPSASASSDHHWKTSRRPLWETRESLLLDPLVRWMASL